MGLCKKIILKKRDFFRGLYSCGEIYLIQIFLRGSIPDGIKLFSFYLAKQRRV